MRTFGLSRLTPLAIASAWIFSVPCADAASITATLDRNVLPLGETATLSVSIEGVNAQVSPQLPAFSNVAVRAVSPGYRMVNGQLAGLNFNYTLQGIQVGNTTIGPIRVAAGGLSLSTQPLQLNVVPAVAAPSAAFLRLIANKSEVYVGEAFPVEIHLYFQHMEDARYPRLHAEGFSLVHSEEPVRTQTQIGGTGYNLFIFKMAATPARAGTLQLGPAECALTVLIPLPRNPRDPFSALFGPNFQRSPTNLQSQAVAMRVLPLPSEDIPPTFNGAVGAFTMAVSAAPTNVAVGDPITVKVAIAGRGRLDAIKLAEQPQWREFNGYEPNKRIDSNDPLGLSGAVNFEKVLIPQNHEIRELPPLQFSYFDPEQRQYRTLKSAPVSLTVRNAAVATAPPPAPTNATAAAEQQTDDILHIRAQFAAGSASALLIRQPWFLVLQAAPVLTWLALLVSRKRRESLANNPRARRQREVARRVRDGMKELHALAAAQNSDSFFALLFRLLQEQIGERLDVPASSITESIIDERLRDSTLRDQAVTELHELFQMCNQARFAPQRTSRELSEIIPRAETVLRDLQKIGGGRRAPVMPLLLLSLLALALPARAADPIAVFDQANRLYEQGKFGEAATAYQQLVSGGHISATVYYNLGNAWFKAGQLGRAVAAYRRAQELAPRDPNIRFNLNFARKQVTGSEAPLGQSWQRWFGRLTLNEWTLVATAFFWLWFVLLIVRELRPSWRLTLRTATLISALAALASSARVGFAAYHNRTQREGVVIVPQTVVRLGPLDDSRVHYQLRDGSEIVVLDEKSLGPNQSWLQVRDGSRRVGWLKRDQVAIL